MKNIFSKLLFVCLLFKNLMTSPPATDIYTIQISNLNPKLYSIKKDNVDIKNIKLSTPIFSTLIEFLYSSLNKINYKIVNANNSKLIFNTNFFSTDILNYTNLNTNYLKNNSIFHAIMTTEYRTEDKTGTKSADFYITTSLKPLYSPFKNSIIKVGDILQGRTWIGKNSSPNLFGKINVYLVEQNNNEAFIASVDPDDKGFWKYQIKNEDIPTNITEKEEIKLRIEAQLINQTDKVIIDSYDQVIRYFVAPQFPFTLSEYKEPIETIEATGYNNDIIAGINQGANSFKLVDYKKEDEKFSPDTIASNINGFILNLAIDSFGNIITSGFQGSKTFLKKFSIENRSEDLDFANNTNSVLQDKSCPNQKDKLFIYGDKIIMASCLSTDSEKPNSTNPALLFFDKDGTLDSETKIQGLNNATIQDIVMPSLKEVVIGSRSNTDQSVWLTSIDLDSSNQSTQNLSLLSQHSIIKILVQKLQDSVKYIVVAIDEVTFKLKVIRLNSDFSIDDSFKLAGYSGITNPIDAALTEDGNLFVLFYNNNNNTSNIAFFDQDGDLIKYGTPFEGLPSSLILQDISAIVTGSVFVDSQPIVRLANYSTGTNIFTNTEITPNIPRHSFSNNSPSIFDIFGTAPTTGLITLAVKESDKNSFPSGFLAPLIDGNYTLPLAIPNEKSVIRSSSNYFNGNKTISDHKTMRELMPPRSIQASLRPFPNA